jgi:hypothetical protein
LLKTIFTDFSTLLEFNVPTPVTGIENTLGSVIPGVLHDPTAPVKSTGEDGV